MQTLRFAVVLVATLGATRTVLAAERTDPGWDGRGNHRTYETQEVRPRFDFGYSPTHHAGGETKGELGGLVFRGDYRYPERMACYGDRLDPLTLHLEAGVDTETAGIYTGCQGALF